MKYLTLCVISLLAALFYRPPVSVRSADAVYYVSSSSGSDSNDGLSPEHPFQTMAKVNALNLLPGDSVLLRCGDIWRGEQLIVRWSGSEAAPITLSSYPAACVDQPLLSGSLPINGWASYSGQIYMATLPADRFPLGINQLFREGRRLTLGRWPNYDPATGGFAFIDSHTTGSNQMGDLQLPQNIHWEGAILHIKNIRWSMLDRQVTASSGTTLTLNQGFSCLISGWTTCAGWGYFLNNHLGTLDQDGEWYYDADTHRVYLYSSSGTPALIEGSPVLEQATPLRHGGLMLSDGSATSYVVIDNLALKNWFNHGLGTPGGMNAGIYHHLTVQNVTIQDVDAAGVMLSSWLERPPDGRKGLRGGHHLSFINNRIVGANHFGLSGYFSESLFEGNQIREIALLKNLGRSGMGCGLTSAECTENGDGLRIRLYDPRDSGFGNLLRTNHFEQIGYNGVDVFGPENVLERNFITQACFSKADCGAIRVFGSDSLAATTVYNVRLIDNIIVDIPGNVQGCHASRAAFGMGVYIDNYSRAIETRGNTVISTTVTGILYQRSTGSVTGNTVYNAASGTEFSGQISLGGSETRISLSDNVMFGLGPAAWTFYAYHLDNLLAADANYFFQPFMDRQIAYGPAWTRYTFSGWQSFSHLEGHSRPNWYTQVAGAWPRARIVYNAGTIPRSIDLGARRYLDLDQQPVTGSLVLAPFHSRVLIDDGPADLTLLSLSPALWPAGSGEDLLLTVWGSGFTAASRVRWQGGERPTTYLHSGRLEAVIPAADLSAAADVLVTVYDPSGTPNETPALTFHVVNAIWRLYFPSLFTP